MSNMIREINPNESNDYIENVINMMDDTDLNDEDQKELNNRIAYIAENYMEPDMFVDVIFRDGLYNTMANLKLYTQHSDVYNAFVQSFNKISNVPLEIIVTRQLYVFDIYHKDGIDQVLEIDDKNMEKEQTADHHYVFCLMTPGFKQKNSINTVKDDSMILKMFELVSARIRS